MFWIILVITLILSLALIVMVLLQPAKGGGITAAFGGIGGQIGSTFGQRRTLEALGKGTTYIAIIVAALCIIANLFFVPDAAGPNRAMPTTTGADAPIISTQPGGGGFDLDNQTAVPSTPPADGDASEGTVERTPAPGTVEEAPADGSE